MTAYGGSAERPSWVRHQLVAVSFTLSMILYLDRAALAVLMTPISEDLGLQPMAKGTIFSAFVVGYALFHVPSGWLGDRYGARRILAVIVVLWSAFTAATALAWSFASLLVIRFLFGAAESGATPNITQSFSRWIPFSERARAQGIFFSGMSAGGALAHPLVTVLWLWVGWKVTFVALGVIGLFWATGWYWWYRDRPQDHPKINRAELTVIDVREEDTKPVSISWSQIFRSRNLWAILVMYFTYGYTGYIYITWFPSYLTEGRNLSPVLAGVLAAIPPGLGLVAKPLGGWWSDRLTARKGPVFGRRLVGMVGFGLGGLAVAPGLLVANPYAAVFFLAIADAGAALTHGVCFAVCLDIGMKRAGTVSALMLTMGSLGNILSALAFGTFLQYTGSWVPPFLIAMAANLTGALLWLAINPKKQLL